MRPRARWFFLLIRTSSLLALAACGTPPAPAHTAPCFTVVGASELRSKDAQKTLDALAARIRLAPEDEALRHPKSLDDVRAILRRDTVYLFGEAAHFAGTLNTIEGRFAEASLELLMGESQLVASQVLSVQEAWVSGDLRIARANLASERGVPSTDRGRMLAQLIFAVEQGDEIAAALATVAPSHLARGAELVRALRSDAASEPRTYTIAAEYHRLRGEWPEFDAAMKVAEEKSNKPSPALRYLRAMEQLERYRKPSEGTRLLRETLKDFPNFVRGQAALVLMAPSPRAATRELAKLKAMNQDHYMVMLLEPSLAAEEELLHLQNGADDVAP